MKLFKHFAKKAKEPVSIFKPKNQGKLGLVLR
jgi:hypothetical protein